MTLCSAPKKLHDILVEKLEPDEQELAEISRFVENCRNEPHMEMKGTRVSFYPARTDIYRGSHTMRRILRILGILIFDRIEFFLILDSSGYAADFYQAGSKNYVTLRGIDKMIEFAIDDSVHDMIDEIRIGFGDQFAKDVEQAFFREQREDPILTVSPMFSS